ncbi:thioredoxin-like protein [Dendryphion nanum]|uniref:Thioredoxin-like protein n=1 Tax=Dendryphion nanum TaxID=256645 RepID=A0A9P9D2X3_9PLEO|nr:thioredoxin-like protein [Dendryphion nanum]
MAAIINTIKSLFRRKQNVPLVCSISLDEDGHPIAEDPSHKHTAACFIDFEPLAVVELFQSQGCQACPPAVPDIQEAAKHPNLLLLTYNVTIFDHLGWKDTFAKSAWDQRQRAYVKKWQRTSLFTPQVVVNGAADGSGAGGKGAVEDIVRQARGFHSAMDWHIYLDANDTEIRIDTDRAEVEAHDILVVLYHDGEETVKIGKGPNKGKKLKHRNVVKDIIKIGEWHGGDLTLQLPVPKSSMQAHENAVVLVQAGSGGPIVAAVNI